MPKDKATEKELSELHGKVTKIMLQALDQCERAEVLLGRKRDVSLPEDVTKYLESQVASNPALFTSITKFLKDNDITVQPEESETASELRERLSKKRKVVGNVIPITEE